MATPTFSAAQAPVSSAKPQLDKKPGLFTIVVFFAVLAIGLLFTAYSLIFFLNDTATAEIYTDL